MKFTDLGDNGPNFIREMDSQGYTGSRDSFEDDAGKKEYYGKVAKPGDVVKQGTTALDNAFNHKEDDWSADFERRMKNEAEEDAFMSKLAGLQQWDVIIMNNFYGGKYPDYSARQYAVVASSPEEARQVVLNNADYVLKDLLSRKLQSGKRVLPANSALPIEDKRVGDVARIKPGSITTVGYKKMLTPDGVKSMKFASGKIVDVEGEQGVDEAKASSASFRASNDQRAALNAMSPEERAEYDKKRAEQQRKRDDARLERERSKNTSVAEEFNGEYDDEAGMAKSNLRTLARAVNGLLDTIGDDENLPEWAQENLAKAEMMTTGVWDYLLSQEEQGIDPKVEEASLASMRDYFSQTAGNSVEIDNDYGAPERKKSAIVPPHIQALINKMYHVGKITPLEFETLQRFQAKTGVNVGLKIKEAGANPYAIGMSQAMKSTGDKPPLKKSTINKAHAIARAIKKGE